jgi:D-glycero-alpha-D-manno-heptose-7-phosphate kinase
VYSVVENVTEVSEIQHPAARAVLQWNGTTKGLEIHHDGDLPARSGLGSSSSFTVGLINAVKALEGQLVSKDELARDAIHIEQCVLREPVGSQDQISAAFGGFNRITFRADGSFDLQPIILPRERHEQLQSHLMLFFSGISRFSSDVAKTKIENMNNRARELNAIYQMVDQAIEILRNPGTSIEEFGALLHEAWLLKKRLSDRVSTQFIDNIYDTARRAGAIGGKILGAGGGGFLLLFVAPEHQEAVRDALKELIYVPFKLENAGSRIVLYSPTGL